MSTPHASRWSLGFQNAMLAGFFAGVSSVVGKVLGSPGQEALLVRAVCLGALVVCTVLMIGFMTRSMVYMSTLAATVTNTAGNFIITVFCSWFIFGEQLSWKWFLGSTCIIIGLFLILQGEAQEEKQHPSTQ